MTKTTRTYRYAVRNSIGHVISQHRTAAGAIRAAVGECRAQGLVDDGAYAANAGWPAIIDRRDGRRIDYPAPQQVED